MLKEGNIRGTYIRMDCGKAQTVLLMDEVEDLAAAYEKCDWETRTALSLCLIYLEDERHQVVPLGPRKTGDSFSP